MACQPRRDRFAGVLLGLSLLVAGVTGFGAAAAHAQAKKAVTDHTDSRFDVYAGYGYFHPINSGINGYQYQDVSNPNATVSVAGYFNRYVGLQMEGGYFSGNGEHTIYSTSTGVGCPGESCDQLVYTAEAGPIVRLPLGAFVPFIHTLGGGARINGPVLQPLFWGWGVTAGAGLDIVLPYFNHRFAVRPLQVDWQYSQVVYGPLQQPLGIKGGFGEIDAMKVSGGLVARFGDARGPAPVQLGCGVEPVSGYPGDPLKVNATTLNTNPRKKTKPVITWTSNGGKIVGAGLNPEVDTAGMKPGEYIVHGHYQEGMRAREQANCDAPFTIKAFEPPTITCTATPNVANSGTDIAISTEGRSPQNRPLTYSYSTSAGEVASNGPTAILTTSGLSAQTITVTCNVVDDLGQTASAQTMVTLKVPIPPVVVQTEPLCGLKFERDKKRPARVDNESKGCLDDIALTLNQKTDARLVMVGNYQLPEKEEMGAQRAMNARQYLTKEKGIDPSRIELRIGDASSKSVTDTLVPSGATYNDIGSHRFDESAIKRVGPAYGVPRKHAEKASGKHKPEHAATAPVVSPNVAPTSVAPESPTPAVAPAAPTPSKTPPASPGGTSH
jgi:hypothetical protein